MARVKCLVCVRFTCVAYFSFPLSPSRLFPSLFIYVTPGFHGPMCRPMLLLTGGMWRCRGAFQTVPLSSLRAPPRPGCSKLLSSDDKQFPVASRRRTSPRGAPRCGELRSRSASPLHSSLPYGLGFRLTVLPPMYTHRFLLYTSTLARFIVLSSAAPHIFYALH